MLAKDELKHLAKLARIRLNEEELEKFQNELSRIVEFVGQLAKVEVRDVEKSKQTAGLESVFREDKERGFVEEKGETLIEQAPETQQGFVVVPEVFKEY